MDSTELSKAIAEKLEVYVKDPSKRSAGYISARGYSCQYASESLNKEGEGCLVGSFFPKESRLKIDEYFKYTPVSSGVVSLCSNSKKIGVEIPEIILNNIKLFKSFQKLHDNASYWQGDSFNAKGKQKLEEVIVLYSLDREAFKNILDN